MRRMPGSPTSFDAQAADFDRRVGLPEADCRAVAAAVLGVGQAGPGGLVVEIGAGTGMIGRWFLAPPDHHAVRYAGLDVSRGMLEVFRRRSPRAPLVQADGMKTWPLPAASVNVIFSSRAIHLLPREHVVGEALRVAPRGALVIGRVERQPESVKARLAREMRRRLRDLGFSPRDAGSRRLLQALLDEGARDLERTEVVRWPARQTPREALDQWSGKEGLGGIVLPPGIQEEVLRELEAWALETFGGLDLLQNTEEAYVLDSVRLPG
ncbi:MAG TPA: class I SAM-dependent methyltransferase [Thermoanaerobaculia bacterium]|nr:class I SAM-dependent methyltransferase [Thermoanaerobaculia bacterium]